MVGSRCLWPGIESEEEDPVGCPCTWGQEDQEQSPESPHLHGQSSSCPIPLWCVPAVHQGINTPVLLYCLEHAILHLMDF